MPSHGCLSTRRSIRKYDGFGPRYTSYPTADRFTEVFGAEQFANALLVPRDRFGAAIVGLRAPARSATRSVTTAPATR